MTEKAPTRKKDEGAAAFLFRSLNYYMEPDRRRMGVTHGEEMAEAIKELDDARSS